MAQLHFFAVSDRGVSTANNDAFCAEKIGNYHVFGVAEGRSDLSGSGSASTIAISSLRESAQIHKKSPSALLEGAVHQSETRIHMHAVKSPENIGDSTHLSACVIDDALNCTILDTGEGNAYLISPDSIHIPRGYPSSGQPEGLGDYRDPTLSR
jgi:serine/threonine protein phosphatase PrpC